MCTPCTSVCIWTVWTDGTAGNQAHVSRYPDPVCLLVRQVQVQQTKPPASCNGLFSRRERFRVRRSAELHELGFAYLLSTNSDLVPMFHFILFLLPPLQPPFRRRSPLFFFFLSPTSFYPANTTPYYYYYYYYYYHHHLLYAGYLYSYS